MPQQNLGQIRVVDPVISTAVRGYKNSDLIGTEALFPRVGVPKAGGTRIEFGKEDFRAVNTRRAPGSRYGEVQFGHEGAPYACTDHGLVGKVPAEHLREAAGQPGYDKLNRAATSVMQIMLLEFEREQAALATTAGNYPSGHKVTLTGNDQWSKANEADSDPLEDVTAAKAAIRGSIGREPNTMVIGYPVYQQLRKHAKLIESIKYSKQGIVRLDDIKAYFDIERLFVGGAVTAAVDDTFSDVWGKHCILAWTGIGANEMGEPSFGFSYYVDGYPSGSAPWFDNDTNSWKTKVDFCRSAEIVGAEAGYLITNAVA